jgi:hypothetical protein
MQAATIARTCLKYTYNVSQWFKAPRYQTSLRMLIALESREEQQVTNKGTLTPTPTSSRPGEHVLACLSRKVQDYETYHRNNRPFQVMFGKLFVVTTIAALYRSSRTHAQIRYDCKPMYSATFDFPFHRFSLGLTCTNCPPTTPS